MEALVVFWDSVFGKVVAENFEPKVEQALAAFVLSDANVDGYSVEMSKNPGTGLMVGPLISWETDDRKWSVSVGGDVQCPHCPEYRFSVIH